MSSAMFAGVSGLKANQETLDVVGNNLANLNTTGFKSQTTLFSDLLYQTLAAASSSSTGGNTNPIQVGYGVTTSEIESNFSQGSLSTTGGPLDLAIQGAGFFVVNADGQDMYTRAGAFSIDANNYLVDPATGYRIQRVGTVGEASATNPGFQTTGVDDIQLPMGTGIPGQATANVTLQGNLSASAVGPLAQTLTSASPFMDKSLSPPGPATAGTTLNNLADNLAPYRAGDNIILSGTTTGGTTVGPITISANSGNLTLGQLVADINSNFPGSTASLSPAGNIVVTANSTGPSKLSINLADQTGDAGASSWGAHGLNVTTTGKNGDTVSGAVQIYDTQGTPHNLSLTFQKQANNTWNLTATIPSSDGTMINSTVSGILFNNNGSFQQVTGTGSISFLVNGLAGPQTVAFNFGTPGGFGGVTQFGGLSSAAATNQDGFAAGSLSSLSIGKDGTINGVFTNGRIFPLAQLAIAQFANPQGLTRQGSNYYSISPNSGVPLLAGAQAGGRGYIQQGALESSNVDVALEFTRLITAQQGYSVNARSITVNNQVLQELANIIR